MRRGRNFAYYDNDRAKRFAYSAHYSTLTPQVFFVRQRPVEIRHIDDLKRYQGCGMIGASYAHYGLNAASLDLGVNTYDGMIKKLKAGRCEYFVEELEVIAGYAGIGRDYLSDPILEHHGIEGAKAPAKHLIAARNSKAAGMLPDIDIEIGNMIKSGEAARLWRAHAGKLSYQP